MTDVERRRTSRMRTYGLSDLVSFALAIVVLVLGALMLAFALTDIVAGVAVLFSNTDPWFQLIVGFVVIIVGSSLIPGNRRSA